MCHQGIEEYNQEETLEEGICEGGDVLPRSTVRRKHWKRESVKEVMSRSHQGIEEYSQEETLEEGICEGGDVSPRNRGVQYSQEETLEEGICEGGDVSPRNRGVQSGGNIGRGNL